MRQETEKEIQDIEARLQTLPKGTLTYKKINGKEQPYLQWNEKGHIKSVYIKLNEREQILVELEEKEQLQRRIKYLRQYESRIAEILSRNPFLANSPGIGYQDFETIMKENMFYVDKTSFIPQWWESKAQVTLITRPRRFGKTLMLSTVNCFFSTLYQNRHDLFRELSIWKNAGYRKLQGSIPTLFLSFAAVKDTDYPSAIQTISYYLLQLYDQFHFLISDDRLDANDKKTYSDLREELRQSREDSCCFALHALCSLLHKYYGKKVIVLLDEYDTPMQEAYINGYLPQIKTFMRKLFNLTFKTNASLEKGLITGITRITKESMFSDINNISVCSLTSSKYAECFGFTEKEVFDSLECHNAEEKQTVKEWYDGFTIGNQRDIYNPWSITNYLTERRFRPYWANSGGYGLLERLFLQGSNEMKSDLESLLKGETVEKTIDESFTFDELEQNPEAFWSLLLSAGYLKADDVVFGEELHCKLSVTNKETMLFFQNIVKNWFCKVSSACNRFQKALLTNDVEAMNAYLNQIAVETISFFDVGVRPSEKAPERFYHGFVLGLLVDMREEYDLLSNRESGFGRYDIMLVPKDKTKQAFVFEFKVWDERKEKTLEDTLIQAKRQIEEKKYCAQLEQNGVDREKIRMYGVAFKGKEVLVG